MIPQIDTDSRASYTPRRASLLVHCCNGFVEVPNRNRIFNRDFRSHLSRVWQRHPRAQSVVAHLTLLAILLLVSGCSIFKRSHDNNEDAIGRLPAIASHRDTIQLEVVFIERPIHDPLIGRVLWQEVDQVGALSPETRAALKQHGLKVGHISSSPPRALQTLLGLTSEFGESPISGSNAQLIGRRVVLQSGTEIEIQASPLYTTCSFPVPEIEGDDSTREFRNARCVLRMFAQREQDGWANLSFLPEIHHGGLHSRPAATPLGWQLRTTQEIEKLYDLKFALNLSLGEMVVITADSESDSVGHRFFLGPDHEAKLQRLLIVRLADMRKIEPVYAE